MPFIKQSSLVSLETETGRAPRYETACLALRDPLVNMTPEEQLQQVVRIAWEAFGPRDPDGKLWLFPQEEPPRNEAELLNYLKAVNNYLFRLKLQHDKNTSAALQAAHQRCQTEHVERQVHEWLKREKDHQYNEVQRLREEVTAARLHIGELEVSLRDANLQSDAERYRKLVEQHGEGYIQQLLSTKPRKLTGARQVVVKR